MSISNGRVQAPRFKKSMYDVKRENGGLIVWGVRDAPLRYVEFDGSKYYVAMQERMERRDADMNICRDRRYAEIKNCPVVVSSFDSLDECLIDPFFSDEVKHEILFIQRCVLPR